MPIFDNTLFDPQTYGGGMSGFLQQALQSGLLGRSLPQTQNGPTFANGSQGSMGGVPFPIMGQAPNSALPPAAQPIQFSPPTPTQLPPQLQPQFGGNIGAGIQGFLNSGSLPQAIGSLVQGLATGQRADPTGMSMQMLQTQVNALMQRPGMTLDKAIALATNPKAAEDYYNVSKLGPGESLVANTAAFGGQGTDQAATTNTKGLYDPATLDALARRYIKTGDTSILSNAGMGTLGQMNRAEILKRVTTLGPQMGLTPEQISAKVAGWGGYEEGQKTLATVGTRMGTANIEAGRIMPLFSAAVKAFGGTNFPTINQAIQAYKTQTGDPKVVQLGSYLNALTNTYARGISTNPRGPTDSDKEHFRDIMSKYWSPAQIDSGLQAVQQELQAAHDSIPLMKNQLDVRYGAGKTAPPGVISQAQAALKAGASRNQVIQRLEENGYDAGGL